MPSMEIKFNEFSQWLILSFPPSFEIPLKHDTNYVGSIIIFLNATVVTPLVLNHLAFTEKRNAMHAALSVTKIYMSQCNARQEQLCVGPSYTAFIVFLITVLVSAHEKSLPIGQNS